MNKLFGMILLFVVILVFTVVFLISTAVKESKQIGKAFDNIEKIDKLLLTSKVIINNDTLDIISTDWFNQQVTLDNDRIYDYNYIESRFENPNTVKVIDSINNSLK